MWLAILGSALCAAIAGIIYLFTRFQRFGVVERISGGRKWLKRLLAAVPLLGFVVCGLFNVVNTVIMVLHLAVFWLFTEPFAFLRRRAGRKKTETSREADGTSTGKKSFPIYWEGIAAIVLCAVYLAIGWHHAHHVSRTSYDLTTEKVLPDGALRIALIADSHIGTTFDGEGFAEHLRTIAKDNPDVVIFAGDFVDDSTTREDMIAACRAFTELKPKYGIYYSYGNHDKGYYNSRAYTPEELESELLRNGVNVLQDDVASIADCFYIIGRMDKNEGDRKNGAGPRKSMAELTKDLDKSRYMIVIDHQPNDYAAEAAADVDLVLSGHTHGGQLLPLGPIGRWIGANDRTYGTETRGKTTFIVSSGISGWEIQFKTGTFSEYVIIDVKGPKLQ